MRTRLLVTAAVVAVVALALAAAGGAGQRSATTKSAMFKPLVFQAPGGPIKPKNVSGKSFGSNGFIQYYLPSDIRAAYGVDQVPLAKQGMGQTIVLVDSYGTPDGAQEIQAFHDAFFPNYPNPNFDQVFPLGNPQYSNGNGKGQSGSGAAASWAVEAALDIQWSYAIAPYAHIVLLAVPPAETLGTQGFPNLMKAISGAIDTYPAGTVFSMSLATSEAAFGGNSAATQTAKFDQVFQKGIAKGDSFFGASGDWGTNATLMQQHRTATSPDPGAYWPASSPYVTGVGGTQLQYGWTWNPQSDIPFDSNGNPTLGPGYFDVNLTPGSDLNVVWNESWLPAATGGGPSTIYSRPAWQDGVQNVVGNARGVPDLSWNAAVNGGVLVDLQSFLAPADQGFYIIGGTSAATPQIAALTALVNQTRAGKSEAPIGNLNTKLYSLPATAFNDVAPIHQGAGGVISGDLKNNAMFQIGGNGSSATVGPVLGWPVIGGSGLNGYDMTTGLGTPWAPNFVADLS
jgi:subtilase family serine protease